MTGELLYSVKRLTGFESTSHRSMSKVVRGQRSPEVRLCSNGGDHTRSLESVNAGKKYAFRVSFENFLKEPQGRRGHWHEVASATFRDHFQDSVTGFLSYVLPLYR
jgi:hypothetical protein